MKTVFLGVTLGETSVSEYFNAIADRFVHMGYKVVVFTDKQRYDLVTQEGNMHILTWPSPRPTKLKDAQFLIEQIKYYKPSVIISNFGSVNLMMLIGFLMRIPKRIAWVHTLSSQLNKASSLMWLRKRLIYMISTKLITNSKAMKNDLITYYKIDNSKIEVFSNAVSLTVMSEQLGNRNSIVYVGRLHRSKGVDILLRAFKNVSIFNSELHLTIVGSGEEDKKMKALVSSLDLDSKVTFTGSVAKEEVLDYFRNAVLAIVPSRSEAFGYVVIEAMSVGTVVIGSDVGGISEIIEDDFNGLLFESENSEALSEKIMSCLSSSEKLEALRLAGYETVKEKYSNEKIASAFVDYIENREFK